MASETDIPKEYKLGQIALRIAPHFQLSLQQANDSYSPWTKLIGYLGGSELLTFAVHRGTVVDEIEFRGESPYPARMYYNGAKKETRVVETLLIENGVRRINVQYGFVDGLAVIEVDELGPSDSLLKLIAPTQDAQGRGGIGLDMSTPKPRIVRGLAQTQDLEKLAEVLFELI